LTGNASSTDLHLSFSSLICPFFLLDFFLGQ
jgi:hypothetical protein